MAGTIPPGLGYIYTDVNLSQSTESVEALNDILISDSNIAGSTVNRSLIPVERINQIFYVVHPALPTIQKEWVENFYSVNRGIVFEFKWKADTLVYRVRFTEQPKFTIITTGWWKVEFTLQEVNMSDDGGGGGVLNPDLILAETLIVLLDIPLLDPADSDLGFYWATTPTTTGVWSSEDLYRKTTASSTYTHVDDTTTSSIIGISENVIEPFYGGNIFDELNYLNVRIYNGETLSNASDFDVLAGTNLASLGAEIISFRNALSIGNDRYVLSGILRGRIGTEWAMSTHTEGEYFVLLNNVKRVTDTCDNIGVEYDIRGASGNNMGNLAEEMSSFTDTGVSAKPLSPVYLGGTLTI